MLVLYSNGAAGILRFCPAQSRRARPLSLHSDGCPVSQPQMDACAAVIPRLSSIRTRVHSILIATCQSLERPWFQQHEPARTVDRRDCACCARCTQVAACRFVLQSRLLQVPEEQPDELRVLTIDVPSRLLLVAYASCRLTILRWELRTDIRECRLSACAEQS